MGELTSRERVALALQHREPDRVPVDLGGSPVTSMHVSTVYKVRQTLRLDPPRTPVKVVEPYQMLGEIKPDLMDALGVDVVGLSSQKTMFGFANEGWREWETFDRTPVLVPEAFNTDPGPDGSIFMYPEGDKSAPPSGRMPEGGWYFDCLVRQPPINEASMSPEDNLEEFGPIAEEELDYLRSEAKRLDETDRAVFAGFGGASFGDIARVPGPSLKNPKGIRDVAEWYMSTVTRRDFVYAVFERQCEIAIGNLERIYGAVGNRVQVLFVTGTDFGMQSGAFISPASYADLFQPFHSRINDWIHRNTSWKTFIHSCGSVWKLLDGFVEAGFDVLNPVQCSAADMDPVQLKGRYGDRVVFWGGGVDTQKTLPFGTADEVRREVRERIRTFGQGGGYVFNTVHNVQPLSPVENVLAMYDAVREHGRYPL